MKKDIFQLSPPEFVEALFIGVRSGDIDQDQFIDVVERFAHDNYVLGVRRGKEQIENHAMLMGKSASVAGTAKHLGIPVTEVKLTPSPETEMGEFLRQCLNPKSPLNGLTEKFGLEVVNEAPFRVPFLDELVPEGSMEHRARIRETIAHAIVDTSPAVKAAEMACWTEE